MKYEVLYRSSMVPSAADMPVVVSRRHYESVATVEARDLEALFADMSNVRGDETSARLRLRSMMVGDVAIDTTDGSGIAHYCAPTGWIIVGLAP